MIDLSPRNLELVKRVLRDHVPGCEVRAFGSRANWTAKDYSDLDLAVIGESEIESATLAQLKEAFEDSALPMRVDVLDWHDISPEFREVIERDSVELRTGSSWERTTLGACASLVRDSVTPADCGDAAYVGLEHIGQGTLALLRTGTAKDVESTKTAFRAGDILFGKLRPYFRKVVRPRFDGICSTDIWVLRPKAGVDAAFLFYLLASSEFVRFASQGAEGTRMPRAKWEQASRFSVRLPPVSEQRAIAQVLGALDEKIELNGRMARTLEATVQELFRSFFVDAESSWPVKKLAEVSATTKGRSYSSSELVERSDAAMVTLKSFNRGGGYRPDGLKPFRGAYKGDQVVLPGEVVVACTDVTQNADVVGRSAVVQASRRFDTLVASLDVLIIRPKADLVSSAFLYGLTNTHSFVSHAKSHATGTTVLHMANRAVPSFEFSCPPSDRMAAFDRVAEPALDRYGYALEEADRLTELRDTILPKLIFGEVRLADAEDTFKVYV